MRVPIYVPASSFPMPIARASSQYAVTPTKPLYFGQGHQAQQPQQLLAQALRAEFSTDPTLTKLTQHQLLAAIQQGKALPLPKEYRYDYGILYPNGNVDSPSIQLKALIEPALKHAKPHISSPCPVILRVQSPQTNQALQTFINQVLKKDFSHEYKDPKTGITTNSVVLTDLVEQLISGNLKAGLPKPMAHKIETYLNGKVPNYTQLEQLYQIQVPGNPNLTHLLNQNAITRQKMIGLELAHKIYAESQEVEWQSIALSLALGIVGEPTISHIFKDGGPVASTVRTGLMSGIDIMGNILSVMGIVNENLKERNKKLSLETVYGPKDKRHLLKSLFNPQGEAGPDIKQGVKAGVLGGMLGVLFNIPAGTILSMPKADIGARSIIGGIGAAGSAVAIPPVIKSSKTSFEVSIQKLIDDQKISVPRHLKKGSAEYRQYIEKMALKEMNARIGIASSIKATHPIPLVGMGTLILAGEKLGIPREYVQTAYMAIAPVMHNFLRLGTTGIEKFWTIPNRMKRLEALIYESKDQPFNKKQTECMDHAFLSGADKWLSQGLSQTGYVITIGTVLLAAEVLVFAQAFQKEKKQVLSLTQAPRQQSGIGNPAPIQFKTTNPVALLPDPPQRSPRTTDMHSVPSNSYRNQASLDFTQWTPGTQTVVYPNISPFIGAANWTPRMIQQYQGPYPAFSVSPPSWKQPPVF